MRNEPVRGVPYCTKKGSSSPAILVIDLGLPEKSMALARKVKHQLLEADASVINKKKKKKKSLTMILRILLSAQSLMDPLLSFPYHYGY